MRASWRPVAGTICISPHALAADRTSGSNVDSCAMSAATRYGSRSARGGVLADEIPVGQRKDDLQDLLRQRLIRRSGCCGYARRISVMARRSSPFW